MEFKLVRNTSRLLRIWINIAMTIICMGLCQTFPVYRSCQDVLNDLGQNATDGEYTLYLKLRGKDVAVLLYCYDFQSGSPREYIILPSGSNNNYAYMYENVGSTRACSDALPREIFPQGGRSEYSMIRLDLKNLTVDITDHTFATNTTTELIRYATAGDKFASTPKCYPRGGFKIDLTGTPFLLSKLAQWTWQGNFSSGNVSAGRARISSSSYIGCFEDREKRILSGISIDDDQLMTPQYCMDYCRQFGFRFAGVEFRYQCFCGEDYDLYESKSESACQMPCAGDSKQFCGGDWAIRIFSTELVQVIEGRCGGFPGFCFPSLKGDPNNTVLALDIDSTHPCLVSNPCLNEGKCIATTASDFQCQCYQGYGGELCEHLSQMSVIDWDDCPQGFQPESCECAESRCTGAAFISNECVTSTNHTKVICRYGDPSYVVLFNVDGEGQSNPSCPSPSNIISCSYWSNSSWKGSNGQGHIRENTCYADGCPDCTKQARCKEYRCGCQNGGYCSPVTGLCTCPAAYYGVHCETFDYCKYYEDRLGERRCGVGGVCVAVPMSTTRTYGGDDAGSHCIFPFDYNGLTFQSCIEDNSVGPPFACGGYFQGHNSYVDLGQWSPGPTYTLAVWIKPYRSDHKRRTVLGGTADCNDWGINLNDFSFRGYVKKNASCSRDLDTRSMPPVHVGQWYMVALVNNGTHAKAYVNGALKNTAKVVRFHLATTSGFRIGGELCCSENGTNGLIKTVKIWNHALDVMSLNRSMYRPGTSESPQQAIENGLVGHWEFGEDIPQACMGIDHDGVDWILTDEQIISGIHCNIRRFLVPSGVRVTIQHYTGTRGGKVAIYAQEIQIDGSIDGVGAGYRGGNSPDKSGATGIQGETYNGGGNANNLPNSGGGGGGMGSSNQVDVIGQPGGGAGYGISGSDGIITFGGGYGKGTGGQVYGDHALSILYMGSGGGSGGNAIDLTANPKGGRGGNGGGAIRLVASISVVITGMVTVAGEDGQGDKLSGPGCMGCPQGCSIKGQGWCSGTSTEKCWDFSGPGGGGSGGSIYISAKHVNVGYKKVQAMGGMGGGGVDGRCGGNGGMGRIRVDSDVFKGTIEVEHGIFYQQMLANTIVDHSQVGQSQIVYRTTVYGNEVYRGCFEEISITDRFFAKRIQLSDAEAAQMTPQLCQRRCRLRGFMFSGTQYAVECFCDNHLDMSRKRPDSECNMPCSGDIHQTCGGSDRIQVLGPPPAVPGVAYNIYPKCDEWCVTADEDTEHPKWGECDTSSSTETVYQTECSCLAGFMGSLCDQPCPAGTWGIDCTNICTCVPANTAMCDGVDGTCQCRPGFIGELCETTCPNGFYGQDCLSPCNCVHSDSCDPVTGTCECQAGWSGAFCRIPCPQGTFGQNCENLCYCNHGVCSPENGTCFCDNGYTMPNCSLRCNNVTWGENCSRSCDCNNFTCDATNGSCQCGPGYTGNKCEFLCPFLTWGEGCSESCSCLHGYDCDHVTGRCNCAHAYVGTLCESPCPNWTFGNLCSKNCTCQKNQTTSCNTFSGKCECKPGYEGINCEKKCQPGFYGQDCLSLCICTHGASCNHINGSCQCLPGFTGSHCELACSSGFYGNNCTQRCNTCDHHGVCSKVDGTCICQRGHNNCRCPNFFGGTSCATSCLCSHGICNETTSGACVCDIGWSGTICDQPCSVSSHYGLGCQNLCNCINGVCDHITGYCKCNSGYYGTACDTRCNESLGMWGPNCNQSCPTCGRYAKPGCDAVTGACVCNTGFTGQLCDKPCSFGSYGDHCSLTCDCQNDAYCDSVLGTCSCKTGFMGQTCSMVCPRNRWGPNCTYTCDCGPNGDSCTMGEGTCLCKPGFAGVTCQGSCRNGLYGLQCSHLCQCAPRASTCNPIDGSCECSQGYTGEHCDQNND